MSNLARRFRFFALAATSALTLGLAPAASAALEFENTRVELTAPPPGTKEITVEFPFKNSGPQTVVILGTESSCGCTVPEIAEKTYTSGASGKLKARFDIGDRQGLQTKQLTVKTDAGDHLLAFSVNLPTRLLITPRLHVFRTGESSEQTFTVAIRSDGPVSTFTLGSPSPNYTAEITEKAPGTDYEIHVRLTPTAPADLRETLYVRTTGASGQQYVDSFFLRRTP